MGRKFSASSRTITVTTSTLICVSARSGADRWTNAADTIRPTIPTSTSASTRLRWKNTIAPVAATSIAQPAAAAPVTGSIGRSNAGAVPDTHAAIPAATIAATIAPSARAIDPSVSPSAARRDHRVAVSTIASCHRFASSSGSAARTRSSSGHASSAATPPATAIPDMTKAGVIPCQTLKCGCSAVPVTPLAAAPTSQPATRSGAAPTSAVSTASTAGASHSPTPGSRASAG